MSRKIIARISAAVLFVLLGIVAYTQSPGAPPELKINKVKENLYSIEGDGGNVAVYVTGDGVILVDDKFDRDHDAIMAIVRSLTSQPISSSAFALASPSNAGHALRHSMFSRSIPTSTSRAHSSSVFTSRTWFM